MRTFKTIGFSADPNTANAAKKQAESLGLSVSGYIQQLIRRDLRMPSILPTAEEAGAVSFATEAPAASPETGGEK